MKILPSQILKLRFLLSQKEKMDEHDAEYIVSVSKFLASKNIPDEAHPITLLMIDSLYEKYQTETRGTHV